MIPPLELLGAAAPNWATFSRIGDQHCLIEALPPQRDGTPGCVAYRLSVKSRNQILALSEERPGTAMPSCCVERHINPDSTFCLFIRSYIPPQSEEDAEKWWHGLLAFLQHQQFAAEHRRWPIRAQMSHGDAASIQLRMDTIAAEHDWSDEVSASMFRNKGWLSGSLPKRSRKKKALVNARAPCPRGCVRLHSPLSRKSCSQGGCRIDCNRMHPPVLRQECPNRAAIEELVLLEYERRLREHNFIEDLRKKGVTCCGTMENCPLSV